MSRKTICRVVRLSSSEYDEFKSGRAFAVYPETDRRRPSDVRAILLIPGDPDVALPGDVWDEEGHRVDWFEWYEGHGYRNFGRLGTPNRTRYMPPETVEIDRKELEALRQRIEELEAS